MYRANPTGRNDCPWSTVSRLPQKLTIMLCINPALQRKSSVVFPTTLSVLWERSEDNCRSQNARLKRFTTIISAKSVRQGERLMLQCFNLQKMTSITSAASTQLPARNHNKRHCIQGRSEICYSSNLSQTGKSALDHHTNCAQQTTKTPLFNMG